jgi:hypothetical protein
MAEIDGISYQEALKNVKAQHPKLFATYNGFVEPGAKPYGQLTGQEKAMLELASDSTKTKRLAAHTVDIYAKCWAGIDDNGPLPQECLASYQAAVQKVLRASPSLGAAYNSGRIDSGDWELLWNCWFRRSLRQNSAALSRILSYSGWLGAKSCQVARCPECGHEFVPSANPENST